MVAGIAGHGQVAAEVSRIKCFCGFLFGVLQGSRPSTDLIERYQGAREVCLKTVTFDYLIAAKQQE